MSSRITALLPVLSDISMSAQYEVCMSLVTLRNSGGHPLVRGSRVSTSLR